MRFSLVIPVGEKRSSAVLRDIERLDYNKNDFEVIVEKGDNPSKNRNRGIKKSKGEFIVLLNGHSRLIKSYLKRIEAFFDKYSLVDIVGGPQLTAKEENFFGKISGIVLTSNFGVSKVRKRYIQGKVNFNIDETFLTSANLCVRKKVFKKIGGFNEKLWPGEDPEFICRAKKSGLKIASNPEMIIYHKRRGDFASFCKQIFNYGFARPKKDKIFGKTNLIFLIPMIFSIYFLFLPTLSLINFLLLTPFIFYVFLAIIFSFYDSIRGKTFLGLFMLPFLYLFTHLTYGLGMLTGYFDRSGLN